MIPMSSSSPARVTARIGGDFMKEDSTHYIVDVDVDHSRRRRGSESSSSSSHEPEPNHRRVPRSERSERFLDTLSQSATMAASSRAETMTMLRDDELPFRSRRRHDRSATLMERKDTVLPRDTDYDLRSRPKMSDASRLQVQQSTRPGAKTNMVCMPMDNSYPMHDYSKSGRLHTASGGRRGRQASGGEPLAKAKSLSPKRLITSLFSKKNNNQ